MVEIPRYYAGRVGPAVTQQPAAPGGMAAFGAALGDAGMALARYGQQQKADEERSLREALSKLDARQRHQDGLAIQRAQMEAESWAGQTLDEVVNGAPEDGAGVDTDLQKRFTAYRGEVLGKLSNLSPEAREMLELRLDGVGAGMASRGADYQIKARTAKAGRDFGGIVDMAANAAMSDPDSHDKQLARVSETLDLFDLPAGAKGKLLADARATLADATIRGRIDRDPDAALTQLDKGKWDGAIDPRVKATLRNVAEAGVRTRRAEAEQATRAAQANLLASVGDMEAALRAGQAVAVPATRIRQVLGDERGNQVLDALDKASAYGRDAAAMRWATPAEMETMLGDRQAQLASMAANDIRGFADKARDAQTLAGIAAERQRALANDPAAYVADAPAIAQRWQAFQNADATQRAAAFGAYVDASLTEQARLGVPAPERRVLPKNAAASEVILLQQGKPEAVADRITDAATQYGRHWPAAYRDLVRAGLSREYQVLATTEDPVGRANMAAALGQDKDALRQMVATDAKEIDQSVTGALAPLYRSLSAAPDGQDIAASYEKAARLLAYRYAAGGMDAGEAAVRAASDVALGRWDFVESGGQSIARTPKGLGGAAQQWGGVIMSRMKAADIADPGDPRGTVTGHDAAGRQGIALASARRGAWLTLEDGSGWFRVHEDGQPVMLANGQRLEFRFDGIDRTAAAAAVPTYNGPIGWVP